MRWMVGVCMFSLANACALGGEPAEVGRPDVKLIAEPYDYAEPMKKVARQFDGVQGVVIHIGDLNTYSYGYGAWAREGKDRSPEDAAILAWMHTNENNDRDGWHLAVHRLSGWKTTTAFPWKKSGQFLEGDWPEMPPVADLVEKYNPQIAVLQIGTFDAQQWNPKKDFKEDLEGIIKGVLENGSIPLLQTAPPNNTRMKPGGGNTPAPLPAINDAIRELAAEYKLPLLDLYAQIVAFAPDAWNGTIVGHDSHVLTQNPATQAGPATVENFKKDGQLFRTWLVVQKIEEIKARVIDPIRE